jgi:hypothetical protein
MKLIKQIAIILLAFCCNSCIPRTPFGRLEPPEPSEVIGIWEGGVIYEAPFLCYCRLDIRQDGTGVFALGFPVEKEDVDILAISSWTITESDMESNLVFTIENLDDDVHDVFVL